jgi:SCY1-like protein 2
MCNLGCFVFQLCEGLLFLHDGVKLLHRNLSPDSIILNEAGAWKIFGFDFALSNLSGTNEVAKWKTPSIIESCDELMPDFDFLSPDYAVEDDDILNPAADMFTLGMLAFTLYNSKPLFTNSGSWSTFRRNCTEVIKHGIHCKKSVKTKCQFKKRLGRKKSEIQCQQD